MSPCDVIARTLARLEFPNAKLVADAQIAALHAAGYAVVPVEPTQAMQDAAAKATAATMESFRCVVWRAMIAASAEPGA